MKSISRLWILALVLWVPCLQGAEKKGAAAEPALKIHPMIFSYIEGWLSDGESPIATEINLDAVAVSRNQFDADDIKEEDGWIRSHDREGKGFLRYRVIEHKGSHYKIDYQENGGGSLTTSATIEFSIEKREIQRDGKAVTIRVLRVLGYADKP